MTTPRTPFRSALLALGFMSLGALGTVGIQATAGPDGGFERGERMHERHRGDHHGDRHGGMGGMKMLGRAMSQLDLTEAQQAELDAAKEDIRARMDEAREQGGDRQALKQAVIDGTLTRDAVLGAIEDGAARRTDVALYVAGRVMDVYESLDAEQQAELGALVAEHAEQREARRGERRERMRQYLDETE